MRRAATAERVEEAIYPAIKAAVQDVLGELPNGLVNRLSLDVGTALRRLHFGAVAGELATARRCKALRGALANAGLTLHATGQTEGSKLVRDALDADAAAQPPSEPAAALEALLRNDTEAEEVEAVGKDFLAAFPADQRSTRSRDLQAIAAQEGARVMRRRIFGRLRKAVGWEESR